MKPVNIIGEAKSSSLPSLTDAQRLALRNHTPFSLGTRLLLSREPEKSFSYGAAAGAIVTILLLMQTLYSQFFSSSSSASKSWSLFLVLLFKESSFSTLPLAFLSLLFWRSSRFIASYITAHPGITSPLIKSVCASAIPILDSFGFEYTKILSTMGKNASCVYRIMTIARMLKQRELNTSIRDFDSILLSVSNTITNLIIMLMSSNRITDDRQLLTSLITSLLSLLFTLSGQKAALLSHYECLKDINKGKLNRLELVTYLTKLQEDFLHDEITGAHFDILRDGGMEERDWSSERKAMLVEDTIKMKGLVGFLMVVVRGEKKGLHKEKKDS